MSTKNTVEFRKGNWVYVDLDNGPKQGHELEGEALLKQTADSDPS